jgi:hypothetical protein
VVVKKEKQLVNAYVSKSYAYSSEYYQVSIEQQHKIKFVFMTPLSNEFKMTELFSPISQVAELITPIIFYLCSSLHFSFYQTKIIGRFGSLVISCDVVCRKKNHTCRPINRLTRNIIPVAEKKAHP